MKIEIFKDTVVYIIAPPAFATGGPEVLHQLAYNIKKIFGIRAKMFYLPSDHPDPVHPAYLEYNVDYVREIEDREENVLIIPEVYPNVIAKYKNIRMAIWWLSVDNYYLSIKPRKKNIIGRFLSRLYSDDGLVFSKKNKNLKYHLAQSNYAIHHLKEKGIEEVEYLSDYLNDSYLNIETDYSKKENIVVYNPKKGYEFTKEIIDNAKDVVFKPVENMSREEVLKLLQKSKIYIDFGNHPGKDRIPREAAIAGCCVITGKRGSAKFAEDVPIPSDYKFEDVKDSIPLIADKIRYCLLNYDDEIKRFDGYIKIIRNEKKRFQSDLIKVFSKV